MHMLQDSSSDESSPSKRRRWCTRPQTPGVPGDEIRKRRLRHRRRQLCTVVRLQADPCWTLKGKYMLLCSPHRWANVFELGQLS